MLSRAVTFPPVPEAKPALAAGPVVLPAEPLPEPLTECPVTHP
jgi:hypothetical protein